MEETKKRIVIALIIFFSFILIYSVSKLSIGLYNTQKSIKEDYKYEDLTNILDEINGATKTDEIDTPTKADEITKPNEQTKQPVEEPNTNIISINYNNIHVTSATFTNNGFNLNIYIETDIDPILLINKNEYKLTKTSLFNYTTSIDISNLKNGDYNLEIKTNKLYQLTNKLDLLNRINRAKVGNKLITFNYYNNIIKFKIDDFSYQYDILIDPGHGGIDGGTYNSTITEANLNLVQSLYEKERYEAHGLKVQLSRSDDSSGMMMGDTNNWNRAKQRGYAIGYYGVLAKIIYSNHHNSTESSSMSGFEILVSSKLDSNSLANEIKITKELLNVYPSNLITNPNQIYSRNIDTGNAHNKIDGKVYEYTDYYATIRIPLELFNVKTVTYEGAYMSNKANFDWYYNGGWKKVSEVKIKYYVEALGKTYIPV